MGPITERRASTEGNSPFRPIEGKVNKRSRRAQIDVDIPVLSPEMDVFGEHWVRKNEFHVTLIGSGLNLDGRLKENNPSLSRKESKRKVEQALDETLQGKSFKVIRQDEFRVAQEDDRKTIVQMCRVEGAEEFFQELGMRLGFSIELPPTHITLYTLNNGLPIGIYNERRLREITRKLSNPETHDVKKAMGIADIIQGRHYAWGKTAREISKNDIEAAYEETDGNFFLVDLCSAFPLFAQILKERHKKERCYSQAKKIVAELVYTLQTSAKNMPPELKFDFHTTEEMTDKNRALRNAISSKNTPLRRLLTNLIEDFLYSPPQTEDGLTEEEIAQRLLSLFESHSTIYEEIFELEEKVRRGRWQIRSPKDIRITVRSEIEEVLGDSTGIFLKGVSIFLAKRIPFFLRGFSVVSLDCSRPEELREDSKECFVDEFRNTEFYRRIDELKGHMIADMSRPPFKPESVSVFTCFEGWPFERFDLSEKEIRDMATWLLISLKPGGRTFFFPWQTQHQTEKDKKELEYIEKMWTLLGGKVTKREYTRDELRRQMADRELVLVDHSPVFLEPNDVFTALVLEKPKKL